MNEETLFVEALEKQGNARRDFLDEQCKDNLELRKRLEGLLQAHDQPDPFLEPAALIAVGHEPPAEGPGTVIGPYKLIEQIGEGGFGAVYMAEQSQPMRRKVALKILKPGMDTRQVVARFEAERQALALMDHPNIAKVFDAGATCFGRPYFVMELVKGIPITEFCDQNRLHPRQRLELFVNACIAVQHAHQKGIVHRDLKPSNVLVALYDDKPVPKVIDFGVAKAMGQELTEQSLHTGFRSVLGTLEYMSPEQASFNQLDIDTRTDVYSLGILLYELLTGTTPLEHKRAKEAGMLEALRIIREEEAPTLSNRLNTTAELTSIASRRGLEPATLTEQMRGELNWIVMKALEKDRNRRYETATALAEDVARYLSDEPVQAHPPSAAYRLRKFARRNKGAVWSVAAIFLLLIVGIAGTTWGLLRAEDAREAEAGQRLLAEAAARSERTAKIAEAEHRSRAEEAHKKAAREAAVAAAINDFLNKDILQLSSPLAQASHGLTPSASMQLRTVLLLAAQRIDGKFPKEPEVEMKVRYTIGTALSRVGEHASALAQFEKVVPYFQETLGRNHRETLLAEYYLASMHKHLGRQNLAVTLIEENLAKHKAALGVEHAQTLVSMNGLSLAYSAVGKKDQALQLAKETLELRKRHLGPESGDTLVSMNNVATFYLEQMQPENALPLFEQALDGMKKKFAPMHPERLNTTRNLARAYHVAEQIDKAIPWQELVMRQFRVAYGIDDAATQAIIDDLIFYYVDMGWCGKAEPLLKSIQVGGANYAVLPSSRQPASNPFDPLHLQARSPRQRQEQREKNHSDLIQRLKPTADKYQQALAAKKADHADTLAARQAFALALRARNRISAAAYHLAAVLDARQRLFGADRPDTLLCQLELGATRLQQKKYADAEPLLLNAFAGLKQHENPQSKTLLVGTAQRLAQLYVGWKKNDKADEWRKKLDELKKR